MAEEEEIVDLGGDDELDTTEELNSTNEDDSDTKKKRKLIIIVAASLSSLILIIIIISIFSSSDEEIKEPNQNETLDKLEEKLQDKPQKKVINNRLDKMIKKANYLFASGNQAEALNLYEQIASFSESVSYYNLGVAQLKQKDYENAIKSFKKAILQKENICVSSINAAVCAFQLNKNKLALYYIDLADAYLNTQTNSPLYDYYYALIAYYKQNYLESLLALNNQISEHYQDEKQHMAAKINLQLHNHYKAINALEKSLLLEDEEALGLLYARVGDLSLSRTHLQKSIDELGASNERSLALAYVNIKAGLGGKAGLLLKELYNKQDDNITKIYPIDVFLKKSLFNVHAAQKEMSHKLKMDKRTTYSILFHFAPYKIFDPTQTLGILKKGSANIIIDDINEAKTYLNRSMHNSKINKVIADAIKSALEHHLSEANNKLKTALKDYPKHTELNYNLALTYAQLGDIVLAHKHFLKAFYLNPKHYLSGLFALMCSDILGIENTKVSLLIKENLRFEEDNEETLFYKAILAYLKKDYSGASTWLNESRDAKPLYDSFDVLLSSAIGNAELAQKSAYALTLKMPQDVLAQMLYIHTNFSELGAKAYAIKSIEYLKKNPLKMEQIFFGASIASELYVYQALLSGQLYPLQQKLKHEISQSLENQQALIAPLALTNIYMKKFEEAYTLYNQLIDSYNERTSHTLFLAGIAAIGANHHANAIALFELAKLKNVSNDESRYALGLLQIEAKNLNAASIQFAKIGNNGFQSRYFDFKIKNRIK